MAVKVTKVKYVMALYHVTRSTTYMESFIIVSKIAQLSHYAALLIQYTASGGCISVIGPNFELKPYCSFKGDAAHVQ